MDPAAFRSIIDQLSPYLSYLTLYFQGEPYMNSNLFEMIRYARSKKIFVATSTNGHFLSEQNARETVLSGLNKLIISLDGSDAASYSKYRIGGDFEKVIDAVGSLVRIRKELGRRNPKIILQCLYLKSNQHQLEEVKNLAKRLGADRLEFKTAQFCDLGVNNPLLPDNPEHTRYSQNSKSQKLKNSCFRMWSSCVITWDGKVVPCCFDKDARYLMGDLSRDDFGKIWKGDELRAFRRRILNDRAQIDICCNCTQRF